MCKTWTVLELCDLYIMNDKLGRDLIYIYFIFIFIFKYLKTK